MGGVGKRDDLPHMLAPCAECPFRKTASYLHVGRARQIAETHAEEGGGSIFTCHKHSDGRKRGGKKHCAGAMLFALKQGIYTQAMQIGERIGHYDLSRLRGKSAVYGSVDEMVEGHARDDKTASRHQGDSKRSKTAGRLARLMARCNLRAVDAGRYEVSKPK